MNREPAKHRLVPLFSQAVRTGMRHSRMVRALRILFALLLISGTAIGRYTASASGVSAHNTTNLATSRAGGFTQTTTVTPQTVNSGAATTITTTVMATQTTLVNGIIDIEVYNAANQKVAQQYFSGQTIRSGQSDKQSYSWTAPSAGSYRVAIGVFGPNWSPLYLWAANAATITVTSPATATSTRTSIPATATSTRTPTATIKAVPPTATSTSVPATSTRTPIDPTATATTVPPTTTGTATPTPTNTLGTTLTPVYVQGNSGVPQSSQDTVTVSYASAQTAGDINIVALGWNDTTATVTSVVDSAGNSYQVAVPMSRANGMSQAIYYAKNIVASSGNTVTVTFSQAAAYPDIRLTEYGNVDRTNPFDTGSSASGSTTMANGGNATTSASSELLVGAGMTQGTFYGAGGGYISRMITNPDGDIAEDRTVTAAGSYNATAPVNGAWLMQLASFKAASTTTSSTATNTPTTTSTVGATNTATPTKTATAAATSTSTRTPTPTNTVAGASTATPTNTATSTPKAPTSTSTPIPATGTSTKTPVPPTATNTTVPPTNTNTPIAPTATATATVIQNGTAAYPLKVSANQRYLVDQNNVPFLLVGDSPHDLVNKSSVSDAAMYFADRRAHGFNAAAVYLLCNGSTGCNGDGTTYDGIAPFTTPGDLSTPNETYFARADAMIRAAAQNGIVVLLDPIETSGWLNTLQSNGVTKDFNYGVWLGNRYKSFSNVMWYNGNDFQTWDNAGDRAVVQAVANGIRSVSPAQIQTGELNYYVSDLWQDSSWVSIAALDGVYTYFPTYAQMLTAYNRNQGPIFLTEANYEDGGGNGNVGTLNVLRRQEYWTLLSGATGQLYGNYYTRHLDSGWQSHLDSPGVQQLSYVTSLFGSRQWYNLVPDQNHSLVTAGYGTFSSSGHLVDNDYATAARTSDGRLAIVYMPTARTITVDMTKLSGPITARWYDPSNGTYSAISGSPFANSGTRQFTPPGNNSAGDSDWVLVLES